ncbi:hypothetical protein TEA_004309 [Camellia sinensis var. sinensis]|uniref:Uncharacterized protein n=1 Tax=Camellia sinensis var. sinensis TaxID=542762 RepID=A0A4S4DZR1_CAMSN|nr:hypothetical protein TEA_004309 [Camellia sinensis var. sinensis]
MAEEAGTEDESPLEEAEAECGGDDEDEEGGSVAIRKTLEGLDEEVRALKNLNRMSSVEASEGTKKDLQNTRLPFEIKKKRGRRVSFSTILLHSSLMSAVSEKTMLNLTQISDPLPCRVNTGLVNMVVLENTKVEHMILVSSPRACCGSQAFMELEAAKAEIQKWHLSFQNESFIPAGTSPEPKLVVSYLQSLKSSEESLREQLEKAKKKEAAFIVTFAKREQEIAELKPSPSICMIKGECEPRLHPMLHGLSHVQERGGESDTDPIPTPVSCRVDTGTSPPTAESM